MLKYFDSALVLQEVPNEITLAINLTNCPHKCRNCHSAYLQQDIGKELTEGELQGLIDNQLYITCVCLMGGDSDHQDIKRICDIIHKNYLKTALYSGDDEIDESLIPYLDYYKVGSYKEECGGLNKKTTNQKFYEIHKGTLKEIKFYR